MNAEKLPLLTIGLTPQSMALIEDLLDHISVQDLKLNAEGLSSTLLTPSSAILIGFPNGEMDPKTLAEEIRKQFPTVDLYLCSTSRTGFDRKFFTKCGYTDAFLLPVDTFILRVALSETLAKSALAEKPVYRHVKVIDLEPGTVLDFDTNLYLPANNRYVKLTRAGGSLDAEKIERIRKNKFNSVYVPIEQINKFYEYSASSLKKLNSQAMSVTEQKEKLSYAIRDMISGIFGERLSSTEVGPETLKDCGEIIKNFILQGAEGEWYSQILNLLGEKGNLYSHAANTSTLAALFSMGLGIGNPEDMALAGLLHDIGISDLPIEIQSLDPEEMTPAQFLIYQKHSELSVQLIKNKKIIVPENVIKIILQHHERYNGTGYPHGIFGEELSKEAQILSLANVFEYHTRLKEGKPLMSAIEAVEQLRNEQLNDPSKIHYSPELLKKLLTLFPEP